MGWSKILTHSAGGAISMGNWYARYNLRDDAIDLEHNSDGIPYIRDDSDFALVSGTHNYTAVNATNLEIEKFQGWNDTVSQDETYSLDEAQSWDETAGGENLVNYLFGAISNEIAHVGGGIFEAGEIDITPVDRFNSSEIMWVIANQPVGTGVDVQSAVYNGQLWSGWASEVSGTAIDGMPVAGTNLSNALYRVKYRVILTPNDSGETPAVSQVKLTINSQKHIRVLASGVYEYSQHIIDSVPAATTKTL